MIFSFVGGALYKSEKGISNHKYKAKLGELYCKMRVYDKPGGIRNLIYTKTPLFINQKEDYAEIYEIIFNRKGYVPYFKITEEGNLKIINDDMEIYAKDNIHFGEFKRLIKRKQEDNLKINFLFKEKYWFDGVKKYVSSKLKSADINKEDIYSAYKLSLNFLNRTYDYNNNIHNEFMFKNKTENLGGKRLYSLLTYEAYRAYFYAGQNKEKSLLMIKNLVLNPAFHVKLKNFKEIIVYHNTAELKRQKLSGYTDYATSFCGYPGGQAQFIYYVLLTLRKLNVKDKDISFNILKAVEFIDAAKNNDGFLRGALYVLNSNYDPETFQKNTIDKPNLASNIFAALMYIELSVYFNKKEYFDYALDITQKINITPPYYAVDSCGFLKDAGEYEQDAVTAYFLAVLNLNIYEKTNDGEYLKKTEVLGLYILTFFYFNGGKTSFTADTTVSSFSPRVALWDTALFCGLYKKIYGFNKDKFYKDVYKNIICQILNFQNDKSGGLSESAVFDGNFDLSGFYAENGITVYLSELLKEELEGNGYFSKTEGLKNYKLKKQVELKFKTEDEKKLKTLKKYIPKKLKKLIKKILNLKKEGKCEKIPPLNFPDTEKLKNINGVDFKFNGDMVIKCLKNNLNIARAFLVIKNVKSFKINCKYKGAVKNFYLNGKLIGLRNTFFDNVFYDGKDALCELTLKLNWNNYGFLKDNFVRYE